MTWWMRSLTDRKVRQRGSILSGLLIIVAFVSILVGALLTELTSSFLVSRSVVARQSREATVTSAVELGIHRLQTTGVPAVCAQDSRGPWFLSLNNSQAAVTQTCAGIVPDFAGALRGGTYPVDAVHDFAGGQDRYVTVDSSGVLRAYLTGDYTPLWAVATGGAPTGPPMTKDDPNGSVDILVPQASGVALLNEAGARPTVSCTMPASTAVTTPAAAEETAGTANFPGYAFIGGSGAGAQLYVYNAAAGGSCAQLASAALNGSTVGAPLVFTGKVTSFKGSTTTRDEVFILVSDGSNTTLEHFRYQEIAGSGGSVTRSLTLLSSLSLTSQVGGTARGYAASTSTPTVGTNVTLAVAGSSGGIALVNIAVLAGGIYTPTIAGSKILPGAISHAPAWCHCPTQDLIGAGSTNGTLYLLDTSLNIVWTYDGSADGSPAINTTPATDEKGDWYFGATDGYVYDVEIPLSGSQLFKAARFGSGGTVTSSPVVGGASACGANACVYFGSSVSGIYFAALGTTRIIDLQACISASAGSTSCALNPRLWARVEVGSAGLIGANGVFVQGWSYYSP